MHLMKYDPATGEEKPYPSEASQYRKYHGAIAWLYNPYTGGKRDPRDIGSDVLGHLVEPKLPTDKDNRTPPTAPNTNGSSAAFVRLWRLTSGGSSSNDVVSTDRRKN